MVFSLFGTVGENHVMFIRVSSSEDVRSAGFPLFGIFPRVVHFPRFVAGGRAFGGFILLIWLRSEANAETNRTFVGRDWVQQRRQVEEEISAQRLASEANGSFFVYCMCQMYSVNIVF